MISLDTNHIRRLHPDWEVVTALCEHHTFETSVSHPHLCALCGYRQSNVRHEPQTNDEAGQ